MSAHTQKAAVFARPTREVGNSAASFPFRVIQWFVERDRQYRDAHKLRNLTDERLDDLGIARKDANGA